MRTTRQSGEDELAKQYVIKVADCDHESIDIERAVLKDLCPDIQWLNCRTEDKVIAECADADALLIMYAPLTRHVMGHLKKCKIIARYGVGYDTIDTRAAADLGIIASNVPDYGTQEVSDHALAMFLHLSRKIGMATAQIKQGTWDFRLMRPVPRHGLQTIGIIGIGRIGSAMAHKTHALGMKVIAYDPYVPKDQVPDYVTLVGFEDLMRQADVVSVHCPLTDETRLMVGDKMLRLMKPTAYLINTARGNIVDETALERVLAEKKLAGAGLDVFATEPALASHPLMKHDNFICSPHMAWHSTESAQELKRKAAEEVHRVLTGEAPLYQVNKF